LQGAVKPQFGAHNICQTHFFLIQIVRNLKMKKAFIDSLICFLVISFTNKKAILLDNYLGLSN